MERYAGRTFSHRGDVASLISASRGRENTFEELTFYAKFITKAGGILKRPAGEDVSRLAAEYGEKFDRSLKILRELAERMTGEEARTFIEGYLTPTPQNLKRLLELFGDLARIKNYNLDEGRPAQGPA